MCICFSGLACFLMISLACYKAVEWLDGSNSNPIVRSTTSIPDDLFSSLEDLRPLGKELPIVLYQHQHKKNTKNILEFNYPDELGHREAREADFVDFGDIDLKLLSSEEQKRQIYIVVEDLRGEARSLDRERDDDMENYWVRLDFFLLLDLLAMAAPNRNQQ